MEKRRLLKIDAFAFGYDTTFLREVIRSHPLFKEISEEDITIMIEKSQMIDYPKDAYILKKGDFPSAIFLLVEGVVRKEIDADTQPLLFLGSTLGIHFLLNQTKSIDFGMKAESNCRLLKIGLETISKFINKYPNFEKIICLMYFQHFLQVQKQKKNLHDVG